MEYTDYYVVQGNLQRVRDSIAKVAKQALIVDSEDGFLPFVVVGPPKAFEKSWDWLLRVFDAEGAAWGFTVHVAGEEVGKAVFGENAEWGIDRLDNGFKGNLDATAHALGTTAKKLEMCFDEDGAVNFCTLVGFNHQYMLYPHEEQMPKGIALMSEM